MPGRAYALIVLLVATTAAYRSTRTETDKVEYNRPPFRRTREDVLNETLDMDEEDDDEPETERALRVDAARMSKL